MESSYKKLAKLRDETIFILKTEKKKLEPMLHNEKGQVDTVIAYTLRQFEELFALYEIE